MRRHTLVVTTAVLTTAVAETAFAGALGIPLDSFMTKFTDFVVGIGLPVGLLGLTGWAAAHLNNTFGAMIGGSINLFTTAGLLGGALTIMGALGLSAGALLP